VSPSATPPLPSLTALNEALERAAGANRRVEPGEHVFPLVARLDLRGTAAVWNIVSLLADRAPDVYNCFVGEQNLFAAVVEIAEEHNYDPELAPGLAPPRGAVSWSELVDGLVERANARWVVGVPLANIRPPRAYVELAPDAGLSAAIEAQEWGRFGGTTPEDPFAIERHLGARLSPGMRWQRGSLDQADGRLDTRRMSLLALVEAGSHTMAVNRAITRARYALAVWCLQAPPANRTLWPSTADWVPRPSQEHHIT
jgi:hypothetical protein